MRKESSQVPLRTVELFCGIGGFRQAADLEGFSTVWANDSCPKACHVYRNVFGEDELVQGDIWELWQRIPKHDLLTAGFPCQPFSSAGKKQGLRDRRGHLFEVILKVLQKHRPRFFILENVKRLLCMESGSHFATILSKLTQLEYQVEWRLLNAIHFGLPQNRCRIFLLGQLVENIDNPHIHLASETEVKNIACDSYQRLVNSSCWQAIEEHRKEFAGWGLAIKGKFFDQNINEFTESKPFVPLKAILEQDVDDRFDFTESTLERIQNSKLINRFVDGVQIVYNQSGGSRMGYTVFGVEGVTPTLTSTTSRHYERYKIGDQYRILTNVEYARLQGFTDHHCEDISIYDQYKLYGNAVPPVMVRWVMKKMLQTPQTIPSPQYLQLSLF